MRKKRISTRLLWTLLICVHLLIYLGIWIIALYDLSHLSYSDYLFSTYTNIIGTVLLWTPLVLLHLGVYVYTGKPQRSTDSERQAYREGFSDAIQRLADRSYDLERLTLYDDELVELPQKRKREV